MTTSHAGREFDDETVDRLQEALKSLLWTMVAPPTGDGRWNDEPGPDDASRFDADAWSYDVAEALVAHMEQEPSARGSDAE